MKFSVIIPVYNVEPYLEECLDSLLAQTYQDYEVLLINDGSTDASGKICDRYSEKDSRIIVFHQPNKGVSAARNLGIEKAQGEWITFIDSDDYVDENYLYSFSTNLSENCGMVIQGFRRFGKVNDNLCEFSKDEKISVSHFFERYRIWPHFFSPFAKIFQNPVIKENNIRFDESVSYGEDTLFNLDYAYRMNGTLNVLNCINYNYRFNFEGLAVKEVGFCKRKELLEYVHQKLIKITSNRTDLYPYCVALLRILYLDKNVDDTRDQLKLLMKNYKHEILNIYAGQNLNIKIISFFIKYDCSYILDKIFSFSYRNEKQIEKRNKLL